MTQEYRFGSNKDNKQDKSVENEPDCFVLDDIMAVNALHVMSYIFDSEISDIVSDAMNLGLMIDEEMRERNRSFVRMDFTGDRVVNSQVGESFDEFFVDSRPIPLPSISYGEVTEEESTKIHRIAREAGLTVQEAFKRITSTGLKVLYDVAMPDGVRYDCIESDGETSFVGELNFGGRMSIEFS